MPCSPRTGGARGRRRPPPRSTALVCLLVATGVATATAQDPAHDPARFFEAHCVTCHGPEKSKGDVTLHDLDTFAGDHLATWELVLDMLESGEMPPEDEPQPSESERAAQIAWIDQRLRAAAAGAAADDAPATTRRLTNFEYHNTLRDLLGIELELTDDLPKDPVRRYRFDNAARDLLIGLEQLDRYEECARRALASVLVDPEPPEIHRTRQVWTAAEQSGMPEPSAMQRDELGVFGNRNNTVANGMRVFERPVTGSFRIRLQASAILPPGVSEMPLAIYMGHDIVGVGVNPAAPAKLVGILRLTDSVDEPQVFELTGRVENFPWQPEHRYRRGGKIDGRLVVTAPHFTITPVNVYDDGTLNDAPDPLTKPRAVIDWLEFESPAETDPWPPAHHTAILFDSPLRTTDPPAYLRAVLQRFLRRAFRRPVDAAEVERYAEIHAILTAQLGLDSLVDSLRETLAIALISPDFLYHVAPTTGTTQHALASRLSYFLWGSMPDAELSALADGGRLRDPEVLETQALRLLADPRAQDFVARFTTQWLALDRLHSVPIDLQRFPRFLYTIQRGERAGREVSNRPTIRDHMLAESTAFVGELIRQNRSALEVIDSDFAMLNRPLAAHYGIEDVQGHALRPVPIAPEHHLGGLLTQGSVLVGTATGTAPHPVYRAVWLREAILGDEVPAPPADVPALEDSVGQEEAATAVTLKDLLRLHRQQESCNDCHARLDPWGIPFECYDATGRYAPRVPAPGIRVDGFSRERHGDLAGYATYLDQLATVPIDATSKLPNGPEVDGIDDLKAWLLAERRDDIAENLVRRLFTYALGRELTWRDRSAVDDLLRATATADYPLRDLIVGICRSELFVQASGNEDGD